MKLLLKTAYSGRLFRVPVQLTGLATDEGTMIEVRVLWQDETLWVNADDLVDETVEMPVKPTGSWQS